MRVALISKTFVADTAQRQLEWLARQPGIELALVTPRLWRADDGRMLPFMPRYTMGYDVRKVPVRFPGHYHRYLFRHLGVTLHALRPDLVHIDEEPYNPAAFQVQRLARRMGIPAVLMAWQNVYCNYPPPFAWLECYNYQYAAHIIAGSEDAGEVLRRKGYRGPLSVFSAHGVDPTIYTPMPRLRVPRLRDTSDHVVIGYVGRLVPEKGVDLLIDALALLPERCHLRLVGGGPLAEPLRRHAAACGVHNRVEFVPPVPTSAIPTALAGMDVLVLPSRSRATWMEQFGRALIEAMACGVPVVGTHCGAIPHVVGDAGLVVPQGDAAALAGALRTLAERADLRHDLAVRGRARVLDHFTQEGVARRLAAVYASVVPSRVVTSDWVEADGDLRLLCTSR
jgi:glycosyltransferase involved in cell wall biosynthesis